LSWDERKLGRYEHARACRERARAPRAPKQSTSPPTILFGLLLLLLLLLLRFCVIIFHCALN
jgi:uncharacterized protein (TIGR03382 family)